MIIWCAVTLGAEMWVTLQFNLLTPEEKLAEGKKNLE